MEPSALSPGSGQLLRPYPSPHSLASDLGPVVGRADDVWPADKSLSMQRIQFSCCPIKLRTCQFYPLDRDLSAAG